MKREEAEALVSEYFDQAFSNIGAGLKPPSGAKTQKAYDTLIAALMRAEPEPDPVGEAVALVESCLDVIATRTTGEVRDALRVLIDAAREGRER